MAPIECTISFDNELDEATGYASELCDQLLAVGPDVKAELRRDAPDTMDFGATIVVILSSAAALEIARAIHTYIRMRPDAIITITNKNDKGEETKTSIKATSADAADIAKALQGSHNPS